MVSFLPAVLNGVEDKAKHDHVLGIEGSFVCGSSIMFCLYKAFWPS